MPVYMSQFSYTTEAWQAMVRNPIDRREALRSLIESAGGRFIELYYAFGDYDGLVLFEASDDISAAAGVVAAIGPGHLKAMKTTKLLTVEEMLKALGKAREHPYQRVEPTR